MFQLRGSFWLEPFYHALGTEEVPPVERSQRWPSRLWERLVGEPRFTSYHLDCFRGNTAQLEGWGNASVKGVSVWRGFVDHLALIHEPTGGVPYSDVR